MIWWLVFLAALGAGLMAGVFFAFSAFIMRALAKLPVGHGIAAMQSINVAVINPLFLGIFMGTAALCTLLVVVGLARWGARGSLWLIAGGLSYLIGTFLVTMLCNVPLNNALARVNADDPRASTLWSGYVRRWSAWNHLRTAAALAALAAFFLAL
jgi:uncharacterized membrane protein